MMHFLTFSISKKNRPLDGSATVIVIQSTYAVMYSRCFEAQWKKWMKPCGFIHYFIFFSLEAHKQFLFLFLPSSFNFKCHTSIVKQKNGHIFEMVMQTIFETALACNRLMLLKFYTQSLKKLLTESHIYFTALPINEKKISAIIKSRNIWKLWADYRE